MPHTPRDVQHSPQGVANSSSPTLALEHHEGLVLAIVLVRRWTATWGYDGLEQRESAASGRTRKLQGVDVASKPDCVPTLGRNVDCLPIRQRHCPLR